MRPGGADIAMATVASAARTPQASSRVFPRPDVEDPQNSTVEALEEALRLKRGTLRFGPEAVNA